MEPKLSRSTLRPWKPGDEESLVRHANSRMIWRNLRDAFPHPYTLASAKHWIQIANPTLPITNFAIVVEDTAVGGIGLCYLTFSSRARAFVLSSSISIGLLAGSFALNTLSASFLASSLRPFFW
jgi:hypothetical protein